MATRDLDQIAGPVGDWLSAVDARLDQICDSEPSPMIAAVLQTLFAAPAKRLRPLLVLLSVGIFDCLNGQAVELACGVECLHTATLVHDDVVDSADTRRGRETVHNLWSPGFAILSGDYMFALSAELIAGLGRPTIVSKFAAVIMQMARAELNSPDLGDGPDAAKADYLAKIRGKTASLIGLCANAAADLADQGSRRQEMMRLAGVELGMASQIFDDVLDLSGDPQLTGKPAGGDLLQAQLTLPVLLHLGNIPSGAVADFYRSSRSGPENLAGALSEIADSGALASAVAVARELAIQAQSRLDGFPDNPCRRAFAELTEFVVDRAH